MVAKKTRGRVRAGPNFELGTLSTRIANLLRMTLVNVVTQRADSADSLSLMQQQQQQKTSALGKLDVDVFIAWTDTRQTRLTTSQPASQSNSCWELLKSVHICQSY